MVQSEYTQLGSGLGTMVGIYKRRRKIPAVFLIGPPHSGKSVLAYNLSQALRKRGVLHYLLRAAPDGEGDWFWESTLPTVQLLRIKGRYTKSFLDIMGRHIEERSLPLLVDTGGKPTLEQQEAIFSKATHAILVLPFGSDRKPWERLVERLQVPLLADLTSVLEGKDRLLTSDRIIRGEIACLRRGEHLQGEVFATLVERLRKLFGDLSRDLVGAHLASAPSGVEVVNLESIVGQLAHDKQWHPSDLLKLKSWLDGGSGMALYGRAPNWLYAWGAIHSLPAEVYLFDVRYEWIRPPFLFWACSSPLNALVSKFGLWARITVCLKRSVVEFSSVLGVPLPKVKEKGVILDGKVPHWLIMALARYYAGEGKAVAVYQPTLSGAVVVKPLNSRFPIGTVLPVEPLRCEGAGQAVGES